MLARIAMMAMLFSFSFFHGAFARRTRAGRGTEKMFLQERRRIITRSQRQHLP
jgi:hypothetical protein